MKNVVLATSVCLVLAIGGFAQKADTLGQNVELSNGQPCGADNKFTRPETFTGRVVKRTFSDNEVIINGVVLQDARDQRQYVNIDADFLHDKYSMGTIDSINSDLSLGHFVEIKAMDCGAGKVYYALRLKVLRQ